LQRYGARGIESKGSARSTARDLDDARCKPVVLVLIGTQAAIEGLAALLLLSYFSGVAANPIACLAVSGASALVALAAIATLMSKH